MYRKEITKTTIYNVIDTDGDFYGSSDSLEIARDFINTINSKGITIIMEKCSTTQTILMIKEGQIILEH